MIALEKVVEGVFRKDIKITTHPKNIREVLYCMDRDIESLKRLKHAVLSSFDNRVYYEILGIQLGKIGVYLEKAGNEVKRNLHLFAISQRYKQLLGLYESKFGVCEY